MIISRRLAELALAATLFLVSSCSITNMATVAVADVLADSGSLYASDNDPELVSQAIPFGLKTIEGLLQELPQHRGLLLAASSGFTQYAYAFVDLPAGEWEERDLATYKAQKLRAQKLYIRARDYGVRGLAVGRPGFREQLLMEPTDALAATQASDVPLLYWTAVSWAAAISLGKDDPDLVADLPVVQSLLTRAIDLNPDYDRGAIHSFLITWEVSRPDISAEEGRQRARQHFKKVIALSDNSLAAPYVSLAESVSVPEQRREEFESLLAQALAIDIEQAPASRLVNVVMQRRAKWLLDHSEYYFVE